MHCLRWWLPLFLLPLPAVSPIMMILFVATYAIRTKPCAYCAVIILGLMFSTCALFSFSSNQTGEVVQHTTTNLNNTSSSQQDLIQPSSCWIGLSNGFISNQSYPEQQQQNDLHIPNLGWWSAPTRRLSQTHLRSWWEDKSTQNSQSLNFFRSNKPDISDSWRNRLQNIFQDGIYVGFPDSGFKLRLFVD